jgi:hypothetical protein
MECVLMPAKEIEHGEGEGEGKAGEEIQSAGRG